MKVSFILVNKNRPTTTIRAKITHNGNVYTYATGININPQNFVNGRAKGFQGSGAINLKIEAIEAAIKNAVIYYQRDFITPDVESFRKKVDQFLQGNNLIEVKKKDQDVIAYFEQVLKDLNISADTKRARRLTIHKLKDFHNGKIVTFNDINKNYYDRLKGWFLKNNYSRNYFGTVVKNLKLFMQIAFEEGMHTNTAYKSFKREKEDADTIYLTIEELIKLHRLEITDEIMQEYFRNNKKKLIISVKNTFLIGAFCAMRVSDYSRIQSKNIKEDWITIMPKKGSSLRKPEPVIMPIHWVVKEIFESGFDVQDSARSYSINDHIKTLCKIVKIDEPVQKYITRGGKLVETTYKKYELVTSHTARRSGATNMHLAGMPDDLIMACTGHSSVNQLYQYIKANRIKTIEELKKSKYFSKE